MESAIGYLEERERNFRLFMSNSEDNFDKYVQYKVFVCICATGLRANLSLHFDFICTRVEACEIRRLNALSFYPYLCRIVYVSIIITRGYNAVMNYHVCI